MSQSFAPAKSRTLTFNATVVSAAQTLDPASQKMQTLRILNTGPNLVYVATGTSSALTAGTADFPVAVGKEQFICKGLDSVVAMLTPAGTSTVYVTAGDNGGY